MAEVVQCRAPVASERTWTDRSRKTLGVWQGPGDAARHQRLKGEFGAPEWTLDRSVVHLGDWHHASRRSLRSQLYRDALDLGNVQSIERGGAKRYVRRAVYRSTDSHTGSFLQALGHARDQAQAVGPKGR